VSRAFWVCTEPPLVLDLLALPLHPLVLVALVVCWSAPRPRRRAAVSTTTLNRFDSAGAGMVVVGCTGEGPTREWDGNEGLGETRLEANPRQQEAAGGTHSLNHASTTAAVRQRGALDQWHHCPHPKPESATLQRLG